MPRRSSAIIVIAGGYALLGGAISFSGWALDIPRLTDWGNDGISIQPNTCVLLMLAGAAVVFYSQGRRRIVQALGALVAIGGGLTLLQYFIGVDLGFNHQLLFGRTWGQYTTLTPGRMGPPASSCFTLIGLALVFAGLGGRLRLIASGCGVAVLAIAMLSLIGYLYGADRLYTLPYLTAIALQTACMLASVGVALIASIPERGLAAVLARRDAGGVLARRLLPAVVLLPIALGCVRLAGQTAGLYDTAFGLAAMVLAMIGCFFGLLIWTSGALSRTDALRRDQEATLRESEERFRSLASIITDVPWVTDASGAFIDRQPAWEAYSGQSFEEYMGFGWAAALHKEDRPRVWETWRRACETRTLYESHGRLWHAASGEYRYFTVKALPLLDEQGAVREWVGSCTDVHERKCMEMERERLLDSERAARTEVERMARAKDDFLATVSHELRSPLNVISGWAQLLQQGDRAETTLAEASRAIVAAVRTQARIIDDLLDMNRIAAGKLRLEIAEVDLASVAAAALDCVRENAQAKNIRLESKGCAEAGPMRGDGVRLQQLITNLLSNAVKFTPEGGQVELAMERVESDVVIRVSDTGPGIKREFLPRVFDTFVQADSSVARRHGGLGLGLAIVKSITELHGGCVSVESAGEGKGATFKVRLPACGVEAPTPDERLLPAMRDLDLTGVRVLVADDDPTAAELLRRFLGTPGADIKLVGSGAEVLAEARRFAPDILLCDISMPDMDGYELIRRLRGAGSLVPAVAVTAFARPEDKARALEAGYDLHLSKPVSAQELMAVVDAALLKGRNAPHVVLAARGGCPTQT
ncbi:MAG TPA: ATP-binding protein [Phycisphaerae bacterium]|nr:ATP-binding protein [Phycisphaerae bacterium]